MASSSSSSSTKHDIFLSFRSEDTRHNFTSHLYAALHRKNIDTFIDDKGIKRGDELSPTLLGAIEGSKISIIIFSENYASSAWCLNELAKIIECKKKMLHIVLPVFYNIDPSDVRKQNGSYKEAFARHVQKHDQIKIHKWKVALQEAANIAGWDSSNTRLQAELVENIVNDVLQKLNGITDPQIPHGLVGVEKQITHIESLLCLESTDVRIVAIWGMGGIGKTTIADVLFKKLSSQFQSCAFIEDVREKWTHLGKYKLRNKLFRQILEDQMLHIETSSIRSTFIVDRLQRRKVLIILDNVSDSQQMNYLVEEKDWFGLGSRIIVTTRNKDELPKKNIGFYEVKPLNNSKALQLFCLKAFQQDYPKDEFKDLCRTAITYARGIPLAIIVLGSLLCSKNEKEWQGTLQKLKTVGDANIHGVLRLSYEELDYQEKDLFLDIACCLKGEMKGRIIDLLEGYGSSINTDLRNLHDKSLITISESEPVQMHDLIQEMGWHIVREESIKQPDRWSRLWDSEDIYDVLRCKTGNDHPVESISLNMSEIKEVHINPETFARMPRLRLLKFYMPEDPYNSYISDRSYKCNVNISRGLECLPDRLRYLRWDHFPLNALPPSFHAEMLVEIHLKHSPIKKLWDGDQEVANLKKLRLNGCHDLIELPCLKKAAKLEEIHLASCGSLRHVPSYILSLDNLLLLNLERCTQLHCIRSDKPSKSLKELILSDCSNLVKFSVESEKMKKLDLSGTAIEELSLSVEGATNLGTLALFSCPRLKTLPNNLYIMGTILRLDYCSRLEKLPPILDTLENFDRLSTLDHLSLEGSGIETLPASLKLLRHLRSLEVSYCKRLRSLPELPLLLSELYATGCISLETVGSIAPTALMKTCFGGQNMSLLLQGQNQEPITSFYDRCKIEVFDFSNCSKLDENACKTILDEAVIRIKYAAYVSSMAEASIDPYYQLYLCSEASDPETSYYTWCLSFLKAAAREYSDCDRIEGISFSTFTVNFNGISGGDLKRLAFDLELNKKENTNVDFDTSMQRICMEQRFPIPLLRYRERRWNMNVEVRLPGSRVPRWIRYRTTQTPFIITIQPPPSSYLLGFAFCFVFKKGCFRRKVECECYLEDSEGNKTSERNHILNYDLSLFSDTVFLNYNGEGFTRILEKLKEIGAADQWTTFNPKLSFQFDWIPTKFESIDGLKECGVWPIYAYDLESENPKESMELRVQPERNKLKKKRKRNRLLWNFRWQTLIMRMRTRNLSSSSRLKGRMSKFLDVQQQQLPPRKKSKRSQDIDELGGGSTSGIERQGATTTSPNKETE